jgi:hypothetical protein
MKGGGEELSSRLKMAEPVGSSAAELASLSGISVGQPSQISNKEWLNLQNNGSTRCNLIGSTEPITNRVR